MKRILILAGLLLAHLSFGQALWRNAWSTNVPPMPVTGLNNLSVSNFNSGTGWLFYAVGPKTVARLGDVSNIVAASSAGISTNGNQFLGVPLSIKDGALLTNTLSWGTNSLEPWGTAAGNGFYQYALGGSYYLFDETQSGLWLHGNKLDGLNIDSPLISSGGQAAGVGTMTFGINGLDVSADDSLGGIPSITMQGSEVLNVDTNAHRVYIANGAYWTNFQIGLTTPMIWDEKIGGYSFYDYISWGLPTMQWSNVYSKNLFGTNIYPRNATASRLAAIGPDGILTNSQYSETTIANLQASNGVFIANNGGLGTNNILYNGNLASDQLASDTSTKTNYWEAGAAYPGATSVNSGGQLRLNGGLGPARIAITNWNRFTNSICTNVISTVDGILTLYATNGACAGCWTNGASLVTCATNLATNIAGALFFGSTLRISNYVTVSANGSNVFFQPLAKVEMMTVGSVTNGATNLNATVNSILVQPVSGNFGLGTNNPAVQYQQRALTGNGSAIFQIVSSTAAALPLLQVSDVGVIIGNQVDLGSGHQVSFNYQNNGDIISISSGHIGFSGAAATAARETTFGRARAGAIYVTNDSSGFAATLGGTYAVDQTAYTNLNGTPTTFTNLGVITIVANTLTNNGDLLVCRWEVDQQFTKVNTNEFKLVIGGNTVLDSGLQITSNGTVYVCCQLTRNSATSIRISGKEGGLDWNATIGRPFSTTNIIATSYALDTGTNNTIALQGSAQAVGAFTNRLTTAEYFPRP